MRIHSVARRAVKITAAIALSAAAYAATAVAGTLFIGTDANSFDDILPDRLGVATVSGANEVSQIIYPTTFHINGLTDVSGQNFLYAGDPSSGVINKVSYTGALLGTIPVPGIATGCCNEDMIWTGSQLYHGSYGTGIQLIDLGTGSISHTYTNQSDVVGMALVGSTMWISHWGGREVGTWDPSTDTFTPVFGTPSNAGGLAYDPVDHIMWVGLEGGDVVPYTLAGLQINSGFQPFGAIADTVDGLAFLGEAGSVPEPLTLSIFGIGLAGLVAARRRRKSS